MNFKSILLASALVCALPASAQKKNKDKKTNENTEWSVANPGDDFNFKTHRFTTDEGTWMNLDVSPDGKTIVFDMLGDIYTVPVSGGKAEVLRSGIPFEVQPRFSPDGSKISFTSDAGGGDNIWVMDANGENAKQVTKEDFRLLNNAIWMPDGNYLIARKHFTSGRSLGAGELWQYHITGGAGLQLTERKNDQQDVNEPWVTQDGKYLYYSEDMYPGGFFQYNKDPNSQIYVIKRYDFSDGTTETITGGPGGAARPTVSPDGSKLAFVKRVREKTVLYIHDLETGEEWPLYDQLNKDQQEAWAIFGVYPNFDWMPNNKDIVFWSGGKLNTINIETLTTSVIPFTAEVRIDLAETVHFKNPVMKDQVRSKVVRNVTTSPDGRFIIFNALGYVWRKDMPDGTPRRLTTGTNFEFDPTLSPDGTSVVYVGWDDLEKGAMYMVPSTGGTSKKITSEKAIYRNPSFSRNGRTIVFRKEDGNSDQGFSFTKKPGIYTMDVNGANEKFVIDKGDNPRFSKDDSRIFLQTGGTYFGNLTKKLISVNLNGNEEKEHLISKYANHIVPSPNGKWVAFSNLHKVYVAPLVMNGKPITIDGKSNSVPVQQVAKDAGVNIHWSANSQQIMWTLGDEYFKNSLQEKFSFIPGGSEEPSDMPTSGTKIGAALPADVPTGIIAFTNARILTMDNDEVIESGTIVIENNRIKAIGQKIGIPAGAKVYDATGKTIMPGMVDAHAHIGAFRSGIPAKQN
ncbi:MAG: amidohydrolase, partial [Marinirhabdus sp.]|nr:amidohydrolase [Marinirhabdus sp.]